MRKSKHNNVSMVNMKCRLFLITFIKSIYLSIYLSINIGILLDYMIQVINSKSSTIWIETIYTYTCNYKFEKKSSIVLNTEMIQLINVYDNSM